MTGVFNSSAGQRLHRRECRGNGYVRSLIWGFVRRKEQPSPTRLALRSRVHVRAAHRTTAGYGRVEVPTGMAMSSADMFPTPREWVERQYNVIHWTDLAQGGHFLEWEVPHLIADDLGTFFNSRRHNI
jgi:hypothetical protein